MADIKLPDGEATGSSATRWSRATRLAVGTGVALMVVVGVLLLFLLTLATNNRLAYERNYNWLFAANVVVAGLLLLVLFWGGLRLALRLRRGRFGSKLLLKLAGIFTLVGLLPGLLIYVVSYQFVSRSIESWFDVKVEGALSAGVSLASATLRSCASSWPDATSASTGAATRQATAMPGSGARLKHRPMSAMPVRTAPETSCVGSTVTSKTMPLCSRWKAAHRRGRNSLAKASELAMRTLPLRRPCKALISSSARSASSPARRA